MKRRTFLVRTAAALLTHVMSSGERGRGGSRCSANATCDCGLACGKAQRILGLGSGAREVVCRVVDRMTDEGLERGDRLQGGTPMERDGGGAEQRRRGTPMERNAGRAEQRRRGILPKCKRVSAVVRGTHFGAFLRAERSTSGALQTRVRLAEL